ncbi:MAG: hypothetical protein MSG64_05795 [Pyrinomonadaceae bacterium MAG19_C2-C3]|nr:hypothetical protein [Pyrinomonadaceae bacterium MAG19_C2-C3]
MNDNQDELIKYLKVILYELREMRRETKEQFEKINQRFDEMNRRLNSHSLRAFTSRSDSLQSTILQTCAETVEYRADIRDLEARVAALESRV